MVVSHLAVSEGAAESLISVLELQLIAVSSGSALARSNVVKQSQ